MTSVLSASRTARRHVRGFDGVLQTDAGAKPFVRRPLVLWRSGFTQKLSEKADADYKKRTDEVSAEERKTTTLVLVTAHTWDKPRLKRETWLKKKRDLKEWAAVELFDGSQLEHWLADHPSVGAWWAREILALMPRHGARSIDEYWGEFSNRYAPALTEHVLLSRAAGPGREVGQCSDRGGGETAPDC